MLINSNNESETEHVKFISYTGEYPNLCSGDLTLEIDGEKVLFASIMNKNKGVYPSFWHSGGYISGDYEAYTGEWQIDINEIPEEYRKYAREIDESFNANVPYGCCGGCI